MQRTSMTLGAIVVALVLSVTLTPTAAHANPQRTRMVGHLDSLSFVPGKGVVATGWALDADNPGATDNMLQIRTSQTFDTAYGPYDFALNLPRPDVAAAHPGYGSNHGFVFEMGWFNPGTYSWCADVKSLSGYPDGNADKWLYNQIGCATFVVPVRKLSGGIDSVTAGSAEHKLGVSIKGWLSDSWDYVDSGLLSFSSGSPENGPSAWGYTEPPSAALIAAHPKIVGLQGFETTYNYPVDAIETFCGKFTPWQPEFGAGVTDIGCKTGSFISMVANVAPTLTGPATLGSTLELTPGNFTPAPTAEDITWKREDQTVYTTLTADQGLRQHVITDGDVGHQIDLEDDSFADGVVGLGYRFTTKPTIAGVHTSRIGGIDRYAASVGVSQAAFPDSATGTPVVYVASGANFPDALSAGPAAAKQGGPLLLTSPAQLPAAVANEIKRLHPGRIVVVGGPASVTPAVFTSLTALAPTIRITGADRYAVSRGVIDYAFPGGAPSLYVVTGENYPDALSASGAAAAAGEPVLLTQGSRATTDPATTAELRELHTTQVTIAGGPGSVSPGVAASLGAGISVTRASGADRYAASISVNRGAFTTAPTVYLVTGLNYPDGLSGSAAAGLSHSPLYLTDGTCVPRSVIDDIVSLHASSVVVIGGTGSMWAQLDDLYACST